MTRISILIPLLLAACGGNGGVALDPSNDPPGPGGPQIQLALMAQVPLIESYSLRSGAPFLKSSTVWVGDSASFPGEHYVGFYRFDLSGLPTGAKILSASFQTPRNIESGMPDILLGQLRVDDLAFEGLDLVGPSALTGYAVYDDYTTLDPALGGFKASVMGRVQEAVASHRTRLNLRVHWDTEYVDNGVMDAWAFDFQDSRATLTVVYKPQ